MTESNESASAAESSVGAAKAEKRKDKNKKGHAVADAALAERLSRQTARLDQILVVVLLLFAFLLASFPARNSDYWLHLATGRFLVEGKYTFGVDPFAYTTSDIYWVNHSWLFDLLLYGLTMLPGGPEATGGIVAVLLKALAMAGLVGLLLMIRRPGHSMFIPVLCVGLGVLAMAPRMTLQPVCVSLFFLGLTLYFLVKDGKKEPTADTKGWRLVLTSSPRRLYVLPLLCAIWVNLDSWFLLGPALIGLYLLGEKLQQVIAPERTGPDAPDSDELRCLSWVFGLSLAACLLNPHHVRIFTSWPVELLSMTRLGELHGDTRLHWLFITPFERKYFEHGTGLNGSGLAYFPLLLLGLVSFWLTRTHWRLWRLCIWVALAVLSASNMLLVPFFAVVTGPIAALNLQDFAARRAGRVSGDAPDVLQLRLLLISRRLTLLLGIILLVAAWPGWLGPDAPYPLLARRVGWGVVVDPSLKSATYKLDYWRTQGLLRPDDHGFNLLPEAAHYCAWFCPEQKAFVDGRYGLFTEAAAPYKAIRSMLDPRPRPAGGQAPGTGTGPDWQQQFRHYGINHVILTGANRQETTEAVSRLLADTKQWTPLYLDGRTSIFGWHDPKKEGAEPLVKVRLDWKPSAFGREATTAPPAGPGRSPRQRSWWERYAAGPVPPTLDGDLAAMSLVYYDGTRTQWAREHNKEWLFITIPGRLAVTEPKSAPLSALTIFFAQGLLQGPYLAKFDSGPSDALVTGVRAARRAVVENPDDQEAYLALAQTTHALGMLQENHWAHSRSSPSLTPAQLLELLQKRQLREEHLSPWIRGWFSDRQLLRRVQVLTALHQFLACQPDAFDIHDQLFQIYWSMNYYDVALEHLRASIRSLQIVGGKVQDAKTLEQALNQREKLLADRERQVKDLQNHFELLVRGQPSKTQAANAFRRFGLARQALDALLREDLTKFNNDEATLVLYLLLTTGRAEELRDRLTENQKPVLGPFNYALLQALRAAALGDYREADTYLQQAVEAVPVIQPSPFLDLLQGLTFGQLQPLLLAQHTLAPFLQKQILGSNQALQERQRADDLVVLRGLLALEVGDTAAAARHFRQALDAPGPRYDFESKPIAVKYLELLKESR